MTDLSNNHTKLINQIFALKKKLIGQDGLTRSVDRIFLVFEEMNYQIIDPTSQSYDETRTDCDASILGENTNELFISETLKPIIYFNETLIQKGVVMVSSK